MRKPFKIQLSEFKLPSKAQTSVFLSDPQMYFRGLPQKNHYTTNPDTGKVPIFDLCYLRGGLLMAIYAVLIIQIVNTSNVNH